MFAGDLASTYIFKVETVVIEMFSYQAPDLSIAINFLENLYYTYVTENLNKNTAVKRRDSVTGSKPHDI